MVTVGVLAAIINVFVLFTVAIADRAIELIVRNFAASRLQRARRAPVVHDSDTWLPNIPRSVVKYYKHPAILCTVLCTVFLIAAELVSEIGVDVSQMCTPESQHGLVIKSGDSSGKYSTVELGASAFLLQSIKFLDGNLTMLPTGIPKTLTGKECIPCLEKKEKEPLLTGCKVVPDRIFAPGEMTISVVTTDGPFRTVTEAFSQRDGPEFTGIGDLTGNGEHRAAFVLSRLQGDGDVLRYLEYGDQEHLEALLDSAVEQSNKTDGAPVPVNQETRAPVYSWLISCERNVLSPDIFLQALMVYRTIQLETPTKIVAFDEQLKQFAAIMPDDIYRAALSAKLIDDDNQMDDYDVYTSCGIYRWQYIIPIAVCVIIILTLGLVSMVLAPTAHLAGIPYNSRSWFRHAQRNKNSDPYSNNPTRSGYFESMFEEMVLVSDGPGANPRIMFHTRTRGSTIEIHPSQHPSATAAAAFEASRYDTYEQPFDEPYNQTYTQSYNESYNGSYQEPFT